MKRELFILLAILLFVCCTSKKNNEVEEDVLYSYGSFALKDYVEVRIDKYVVNEKLYPVLDYVIDKVNGDLANLSLEQGYSLHALIEEESLSVAIYALERSDLDMYVKDGIFFYRGYRFICRGDLIEDLFTKTGTFLFKRVNPDLFEVFSPNPELGMWEFLYKDGEFYAA
ncbi:MAG: hypothetical protein LBR57_03770 [Alistipes sp.]|jgi:hypothetical protein|nr:hypothetical protein [Alistipes sp.]